MSKIISNTLMLFFYSLLMALLLPFTTLAQADLTAAPIVKTAGQWSATGS